MGSWMVSAASGNGNISTRQNGEIILRERKEVIPTTIEMEMGKIVRVRGREEI